MHMQHIDMTSWQIIVPMVDITVDLLYVSPPISPFSGCAAVAAHLFSNAFSIHMQASG